MNAHELTLEFGRFLSPEEWREVAEAASGLPHVKSLRADAVVYPVRLNEEQERIVKEWAADDRLWTTQDTVEFNLRVFARAILAKRDEP